MKFSLTANSDTNEGFKLSFQADKPEEIDICNTLTKNLIDKIEKISININNQDY